MKQRHLAPVARIRSVVRARGDLCALCNLAVRWATRGSRPAAQQADYGAQSLRRVPQSLIFACTVPNIVYGAAPSSVGIHRAASRVTCDPRKRESAEPAPMVDMESYKCEDGEGPPVAR